MSKFKNIFFDADDTIKDFTREDYLILQKIHKKLKVDNTFRCKFLKILNKVAFTIKNTAVLKTNMDTLDFRLKMYAKILNVDCTEYSEEYYKYLSRYIILFSGSREIINYLKENGYNIFLITNNSTCYNIGKNLGFESNNIYTLSGVKKHLAMQDIIRKYNLKKEETVMIGDNLIEDVYYAKKVGINTIWLNFENRLYKVFSNFIKPDYIINSIKELMDILK